MTGSHRAVDALNAIPSDLPRDEWIRAGMAAQADGLSFEDFDKWSSTAGNYDARAAKEAWRSFKPGKGVGAGTLYRMAQQHGWNPKPSITPRPSKRPVERALKPSKGQVAGDVWRRCTTAPDDHPYILRKRGTPDGLRVVPEDDLLCIAGQSVAGWLAVPVTPIDGGEPVSVQFIPPEGKKLNLPGAAVEGVFVVGEMEQGGKAYVCEGIGQAWACWKATGHAAVCCFGWGRVRKVAAELRKRDSQMRLVVVPDKGKEAEAETIAGEIDGFVAAMPVDTKQNYDANDYAIEHGDDALDVLLADATKAPKPEPITHALARYVDLELEPKAPRFVIPGFIGYGLVIIAGAHGAGKTTALLPMAMLAAGLHGPGNPLAPKHWRHVVYITEDVEQVRRILDGVVNFAGMGLDEDTVRRRLHIVEALRMKPDDVAQVATTYREQFARMVDGVEVPPLVVMDTKSAVFSIDDENSNSEASAIVAMLKQSFENLPVWLVGHVTKANVSRNDVASLTLRGASAFEADANQVLYLVKEDEARYLVLGKRRFEPTWTELRIESKTAETMARDEHGDKHVLTLRWGIAVPSDKSRKEAKEQAQEAAQKDAQSALREDVRNAVDVAWREGFPLNRAGVRAKVKRRGEEVGYCIENLLTERWLHEVAVPEKQRTNINRKSFLVNLTTEEHEAVRRGEDLPAAKLVVPKGWCKPIPSVPVPEETDAKQASVTEAPKVKSVPSRSVRSPKRNKTGTDGELGCSPVHPFIPTHAGTNGERTGTHGNERQGREAA